ncbi:MAG: helix-turn-helix transcriptional regulator, partial [Gemmatimonadota bacterium]|nr:helix-turn-helix transcriptional regulator [Gemmatimonadota bacterium]
MHPTVRQIAVQLRSLREARGISQRELGERIGLTQAQISRFEGGRADLRVSSLVEFGRGLGVEVMLVPRRRVPAVEALGRAVRGQQPVDKIPTAFEWRCIRAGRFASPIHAVKHTLHYVMFTIQCAVERRAFLVGANPT